MPTKNPYKKGGMFEGANILLFEKAKELRKNMTKSEMALWMHVKDGISGFKFRRQHPIGLYIADFYCHKAKLIIEVDGSIHNLNDVKLLDEKKQRDLEEWGYHVIRFTNKEIHLEIEMVVESLISTINKIINSQKQNATSKEGV